MKKIDKTSIRIVLLAMVMVILSSCSSPLFTDVAEGSPYYNDIKSVYDLGLMDTKDENFFGPNAFLSYAEFLEIAARFHQLKTNSTINTASDDESEQVSIDYCLSNGIIDREYAWQENVSRAECIAILSRMVSLADLNEINTVEDGSIPDVLDDSEYYDSIYLFYRAGIYQGADDLYLCKPDGSVKRYEVACMVRRLLDASVRYQFQLLKTEESTDSSADTDRVASDDTTLDANASETTAVETEKTELSDQNGGTADTVEPVGSGKENSEINPVPDTTSKDTTSVDNGKTTDKGSSNVPAPNAADQNTAVNDRTENEITNQPAKTPDDTASETTESNPPSQDPSVPDVPSDDNSAPVAPDQGVNKDNLELVPMMTPIGVIDCPGRSEQYILTNLYNFSTGLQGDVYCKTSSGKVKISSIYWGTDIPYGTFIGYYESLDVHIERFWPSIDDWSEEDIAIYNMVQEDYTFCVSQVEALLSIPSDGT